MGSLPASGETQSIAGPAWPDRQPGRTNRPGLRQRLAVIAVYLLAGLLLFGVYLRLSQTYQLNSDSANILLMGSDLLHGNLLLHGWYMSDVSFYPTELPQYALLESLLGPHFATAHVAAAMTYTLVFLLAVALARSGSTGRAAWIRTLIAAGILLAPQFGLGVFSLDLSVGHIGTSVPLLLIWLLLDKMPPRPYVPVGVALLLAWVLVADPIVYVVGIGPLGAVAAARVVRGLVTGSGGWMQRIATAWYDLSLGLAAVAAVVIAWVINNVLSDMGGYVINRLPFFLTPWSRLGQNMQAFWKVLEVYGANVNGVSGVWLALAVLHLASVLVVVWALVRVAWRFFDVSLVDQVLAVAIVLNVALFVFTNASSEAAHEVAVIAPFGAALAARVLVRPPRATARATARATVGAAAPGRGRGRVALVPVTAWVAGIIVLTGYAAGLGYEITQPVVPPANTTLASWLVAHDLHYGISGYWSSSSVTVDSGNQVQVRALEKFTMQRDLWMSDADWYNAKLHYANFVVLDNAPGFMNNWEPRALVEKYFGAPVRTYHTGRYTIMIYDQNLLRDVPPGYTEG
jgi:hypothetical protein